MNKLFYSSIILLTLAACNDQNSGIVDNNDSQQAESTTWETKFPALWSVAYAGDINPEDVTYEQFINDVANKLKVDVGFKNDVKGDTGAQGIPGPAGPQGIQGEPGQDGANASLPTWETMYIFGSGDTFFYTCSDNNPCTAADITFHKSTIASAIEYYYAANPSAGPVIGEDLLNTGAPITNIQAESDCEYKAELITNSNVSYVLTSPEIHNGSLIFKTNSAFSSEFNIHIGDASMQLSPQLIVSKTLPGSFSATEAEKNRIAEELTTVGTHLGYQVALKRRCR